MSSRISSGYGFVRQRNADCQNPAQQQHSRPHPAGYFVLRTADLLRLLLLAAIWGASFLFMRVAAPVLGSMPTAFFRASFGMLACLPCYCCCARIGTFAASFVYAWYSG